MQDRRAISEKRLEGFHRRRAAETRKWQDQSGQDRYSTEVVLQGFRGEMTLLNSRGSSGGTSGGDFGGDDAGGDFGWTRRRARSQR